MSEPFTEQIDLLKSRISALGAPTGVRHLIAIAGPPGAGKSTLASALVDALNTSYKTAALVPMDGFHLDNGVLMSRALKDKKGAPETFDADGFVTAMMRLANAPEVVLPVFNRKMDIAVAGARVVRPDARIAVVEGNYLLLDEAPWSALAALWDLTVMLAPTESVLRERLIDRWLDNNHSHDAAVARAEANDLPNARRVLHGSLEPDIRL